MDIDELIAALQALKAEHGGGVEVTAFVYAGGMDELRYVAPEYNADTRTVVMECGKCHDSGARR